MNPSQGGKLAKPVRAPIHPALAGPPMRQNPLLTTFTFMATACLAACDGRQSATPLTALADAAVAGPAQPKAVEAPAKETVPLEAERARALAIEAANADQLEIALDAANKAVALAPAWAEARFIRAGIEVAMVDPG